eukprot:7382082-Prymnesium_polylepis.3
MHQGESQIGTRQCVGSCDVCGGGRNYTARQSTLDSERLQRAGCAAASERPSRRSAAWGVSGPMCDDTRRVPHLMPALNPIAAPGPTGSVGCRLGPAHPVHRVHVSVETSEKTSRPDNQDRNTQRQDAK